MADNISITPGSGDTIAGDEISAVKYQRIKLTLGADGVNDGDVATGNPMPITGSISGITGSIAVHILSTAGTLQVQNLTTGTVAISAKDGTIAVYFPPGNSTLGTVNTVTRVSNLIDGTLTTVTGVDRVRNVVDGTLSLVTTVNRINNVIDGTLATVVRVSNLIDGTVKLSSSSASMAVYFDRSGPTVTTLQGGVAIGGSGVVGATTTRTVHAADVVQSMNIMAIGTTNTLGVYVSANAGTTVVKTDPLSVLAGITSSIAVHLVSTAGTLVVKLARDSAGVATDDAVFTIGTGTGMPMMGLADAASQDSVDEDDVGVLRMTLNRLLMTNIQATAGIFSVSGTTSTAGNNTLIAPSASYNFKVYAYSLQTTGIVSSAPRFTTGGSAGATELWRPLINSVQTASTPVGANFAVSPPGFLFATGVSTTLSLYLDTGTLVHYSVSYIKESA